ncbi:hypothetical protein CLV92_11913 [Kineococcus xinjiangensis]|uniref:Uncharacterized protein n=1 Tax=Kineococcus xinjiangensis TaxID=512762 RepID=A0A2S6ICI0_9ACTN|nr:hypothetical protein [Kineococcus xinjiangensis]PPK91932.1 hypothetical protein CLV92_11913 [Kineococcus xinjiangensis]
MSVQHSDGVEEAVESTLRMQLMAAARLGEVLARAHERALRDAQARSEAEARALESRLHAERSAARAELAPLAQPQWWDNAKEADVARAWQTVQAWRHIDPDINATGDRMREEVRTRFGVDVDEIAAKVQQQARAQARPEVVTEAEASPVVEAKKWLRTLDPELAKSWEQQHQDLDTPMAKNVHEMELVTRHGRAHWEAARANSAGLPIDFTTSETLRELEVDRAGRWFRDNDPAWQKEWSKGRSEGIATGPGGAAVFEQVRREWDERLITAYLQRSGQSALQGVPPGNDPVAEARRWQRSFDPEMAQQWDSRHAAADHKEQSHMEHRLLGRYYRFDYERQKLEAEGLPVDYTTSRFLREVETRRATEWFKTHDPQWLDKLQSYQSEIIQQSMLGNHGRLHPDAGATEDKRLIAAYFQRSGHTPLGQAATPTTAQQPTQQEPSPQQPATSRGPGQLDAAEQWLRQAIDATAADRWRKHTEQLAPAERAKAEQDLIDQHAKATAKAAATVPQAAPAGVGAGTAQEPDPAAAALRRQRERAEVDGLLRRDDHDQNQSSITAPRGRLEQAPAAEQTAAPQRASRTAPSPTAPSPTAPSPAAPATAAQATAAPAAAPAWDSHERRAQLPEQLRQAGITDPETIQARLLADISQAKPASEATATRSSTGPKPHVNHDTDLSRQRERGGPSLGG